MDLTNRSQPVFSTLAYLLIRQLEEETKGDEPTDISVVKIFARKIVPDSTPGEHREHTTKNLFSLFVLSRSDRSLRCFAHPPSQRRGEAAQRLSERQNRKERKMEVAQPGDIDRHFESISVRGTANKGRTSRRTKFFTTIYEKRFNWDQPVASQSKLNRSSSHGTTKENLTYRRESRINKPVSFSRALDCIKEHTFIVSYIKHDRVPVSLCGYYKQKRLIGNTVSSQRKQRRKVVRSNFVDETTKEVAQLDEFRIISGNVDDIIYRFVKITQKVNSGSIYWIFHADEKRSSKVKVGTDIMGRITHFGTSGQKVVLVLMCCWCCGLFLFSVLLWIWFVEKTNCRNRSRTNDTGGSTKCHGVINSLIRLVRME